MREALKMYIDGAWVDPVTPRSADVINPATEQPLGRVSLGSAEDVDRAVAAARRAFATFGRSSRQERIELIEAIEPWSMCAWSIGAVVVVSVAA